MRINSIESRRKYFQKIYNYLVRLYGKMDSIDLATLNDIVYVVVTIKTGGWDTKDKYAIAPNGRVYKLKGSKAQPRLVELNDVEELASMKTIEQHILDKAKNMANHLGLNVEKILNPPKKPKKPKTKTKQPKEKVI